MSGVAKKLMGTTAAGGGFTAIEDVFSTYLYTGNNGVLDITNNIDLAGEGGMIWHKARTPYDGVNTGTHTLWSSETTGNLNSTNTDPLNNASLQPTFNSDGYTFPTSSWVSLNSSASNYVGWTFRKAPRFFDVVTYTGDGVNGRQISHNLGCEVGSIFIKATSTGLSTNFWAVYHKDTPTTFGVLNGTNAFASPNEGYTMANIFGDNTVVTLPTSTEFTVAGNQPVNNSGTQYVAYLFAHDPLGPSGDGSDGLIACGSYTGNGSTNGPEIDLGWEPQWVMIKQSSTGGTDWYMHDNMRGIATGGNDARLKANLSEAEFNGANYIDVTATGFKLGSGNAVNNNGQTHIYIAIRRGPMRVPESGTEVFAMDTTPVNATASTPTFTAGFPVDLGIRKKRDGSDGVSYAGTRLLGDTFLEMSATSAETANPAFRTNGYQDGFGFYNGSGESSIGWMFRRAPNFFDVVAYTGTGVEGDDLPHNLGVTPEMIIQKSRDDVNNWLVSVSGIPAFDRLLLNSSGATAATGNTNYGVAVATGTTFRQGPYSDSGEKYIAYLFATLAGVSKVGSYTGNGTTLNIDCGFTSGARFILIKRTDSTGDWYVWDTARGIVTGNDPFLELNTTDAEVTSDDSIDPDSSGFIVNQTATTNVNVSSASYIFMAIS